MALPANISTPIASRRSTCNPFTIAAAVPELKRAKFRLFKLLYAKVLQKVSEYYKMFRGVFSQPLINKQMPKQCIPTENVMERDDRAEMKSEVIRDLQSQAVNKKRSVMVDGHRTSVLLEPIYWDQLRECASQRQMVVNELITLIGQQRNGSLSSAIRVFVLENVLKSRCFVRAAFVM